MKNPPTEILPERDDLEEEMSGNISMMWQGPIPPPEILADYERIVPGSSKDILDAWKAETAHRRKLEKSDLLWGIIEGILGKVLAFLFVLLALGLSWYALSIGASWVAGILGTGTIGTVVWAFIKTNRSKTSEPNKD